MPLTVPDECTIEDAIADYYAEWILMKVTGFDAYREPERGVVLAHSADRSTLSEVLRHEPPRTADSPYQPYYTFKAFPRVRPDETYEQAAERFAAQRAEMSRRDRRRA